MGREPEYVQVTAVAFSAWVQKRPLDWQPPMRELMQNPENAEFVWRRLQYVFRLPDPRAFPKLAVEWDPNEAAVLRRFIEHARTLAQTSLLGANDNMRVTIDDFTSDEVTIEADLSPPDVTTGFMTLLRQFFSDDEEASFSAIRKLLGKHAHSLGDSGAIDVLKQWRHAHATLRSKGLEEHVQERMVEDGQMPGKAEGPDGEWSEAIVRDPAPPSELLRAFWYGGQIHWGDKRGALAALQRDAFESARCDMAARAAALDLAHFYIGFAALVEQAAGPDAARVV